MTSHLRQSDVVMSHRRLYDVIMMHLPAGEGQRYFSKRRMRMSDYKASEAGALICYHFFGETLFRRIFSLEIFQHCAHVYICVARI